MSKPRSFTMDRTPSYHSAGSPKLARPAPTGFSFGPRPGTVGSARRNAAAWKTGRYYSNSGMQNASRPRADVSGYVRRSAKVEKIEVDVNNTTFRSNFPSETNWSPANTSTSMINYSTANYNPLNHSKIKRVSTANANRRKGLSEYHDLTRLNNKFPTKVYKEAIETNPRAFFRRSGEFSQHADGRGHKRPGALDTSFMY